MSLNINEIKISGNLTRDPETLTLPDGKTLTKFTLAVNDAVNREATPTYVDFVAFGVTGENLVKVAGRGHNIFVEGRLSVRPYETKDGAKRKSTEVIVGTFQALTRKPKAAVAA